MACAAITNSLSLKAKNCPRVIRVSTTQPEIPKANITFHMECPSNPIINIAISKAGMPVAISIILTTIWSTHPPR